MIQNLRGMNAKQAEWGSLIILLSAFMTHDHGSSSGALWRTQKSWRQASHGDQVGCSLADKVLTVR